MTRRQLAAAAVATAAGLAQTPPSTPSDSPEALLQSAREQVKRNSEALGKFPLPMATEPAFQFKA